MGLCFDQKDEALNRTVLLGTENLQYQNWMKFNQTGLITNVPVENKIKWVKQGSAVLMKGSHGKNKTMHAIWTFSRDSCDGCLLCLLSTALSRHFRTAWYFLVRGRNLHHKLLVALLINVRILGFNIYYSTSLWRWYICTIWCWTLSMDDNIIFVLIILPNKLTNYLTN
jgi:hypothetical protein